MRQITVGLSLLALIISCASPALAEREGVPGRRVGGGTRWTAPRTKPTPSVQNKLSAISFASRNNLPLSLRLKAIYG